MLVAVLAGATAVGKSALALSLAERNGFEILSADSRQIYRGFTVGTGAPTPEEATRVPHHLVGFLDPARPFSPREYPSHVHALLDARPEARFLLVGGTGLYLKELLYPSARDRGPTPDAVRAEVQTRLAQEGPAALYAELLRLDPDSLRGVHPNDAYRIAKRWENRLITGEGYAAFAAPAVPDPRFAQVPFLWIDEEREPLYARIDARVEAMVKAGWLEEVRPFLARLGWRDLPAMSSLGYREMAEVAEGRLGLPEAVERIRKLTRNYAKRQRTFFRHQFPQARRFTPEEVRERLEAVGWDWEAFRARDLGDEMPSAGTAPNPPESASDRA